MIDDLYLTREVILTIISGVMGVFAAFAAWKSAVAAEAANRHIRQQQLLAVRSMVAQLVATATYEYKRNETLAKRMRSLIVEEAQFVGSLGGSRQVELVKQVDAQMERSRKAYEYAQRLDGDVSLISKLALSDAEIAQCELPMTISKLRAIGDEFQRDSESSAGRILLYLEGAITKPLEP